MLGNGTVNVLSTQITLSGLSVFVVQWLKGSSWAPWFNRASDKLNRLASIILAFVGAVGIHMTWTHGALPGSYMLSVSGLTVAGVSMGLWAVTKGVVLNEIIYRGTVKTQTPGGPAQVLGGGTPPPKP